MNSDIRHAFGRCVSTARHARLRGDLDTAFAALERAHVLSQRHLWPHVLTHLGMLHIGWRRRDWREISGQLLRVLASIPGWLTGWVPKGNTGGANVSALRPMPLPAELAALLADYRVWQDIATRLVLYAALALFLIVWR